MNSKRIKKSAKPEVVPVKEKTDRGYTLEQPIQTALYAKLSRFGRDVS